jgi:integrase
MAKITFHVNKDKKDREGFAPIRAKINVQYKAVVKNIPFKVKLNETGDFVKWDIEKQRFSGFRKEEKNSEYYNNANSFIDDYTSRANQFFNDCRKNNEPLTVDLVKNFFNGIQPNFKPEKKEFWKAYDEFLKWGEHNLEPNSIRSRKSKNKKFKNFESEAGYKLTFDSINLIFFDKLTEYILFTKGHGFNYMPALTRQIKAFMQWSFENDYHSNMTFKKFPVKEKEGSIIYLTYPELQHLINFPFESEKLRKVRDFFCFGCLIGARYSDLKRLTKDNISDGLLKFTTEKTNESITIPIYPGLTTIINRYPDQHKLLPKYSGQKVCDYIKKACEIAEINTPTEYKTHLKNETFKEFFPKYKLISSHSGRKTFICLAYSRGMDVKMIMEITGIKDEKTLRRYLEVSVNTKRDALNNAFGEL